MTQSVTAVRTGMTQETTVTRTGMTQSTTAVRSGMTMIVSVTRSGMSQVVAAGTSGMNQFVAAVRSGGSQAVSSARSTASGIRSAIASVSLYSSGMHIMSGLISGMNAMRGSVMSTASSIARAASNSINNALKIHSPSKITTESGQFTGKGLVVGMKNTLGAIRNAGASLGNAAKTGLNRNLADEQSYAQNSMSVDPEGNRIRSVEVPQFKSRTSVLGETVRGYSNSSDKRDSQDKQEGATFVFSPTYNFEGDAPDKKDLIEANRMSQKEFERMMKEYIRNKGRLSFA